MRKINRLPFILAACLLALGHLPSQGAPSSSGTLYGAFIKPGPTASPLAIPTAAGSDTFTLNAATQTLTNKTLTSPIITGATYTDTNRSSLAAGTAYGVVTNDSSGAMTDGSLFTWHNDTNAPSLTVGGAYVSGTAKVTIVGQSTDTNQALHAYRYGASTTISLRRANGTVASPTKLLDTDLIGSLGWAGYQETTSAFTGNKATIQAYATQDWTSTANGAKFVFSTVPNNGTTLTTALTLDQDQSATFANTVNATTFVGALTGNASTATALAANPADCAADTYATTIAASGALTCATVTNAGLAGSIADTKLSTISTAGKVSNSATTAASANTASAIVARDGSGNFTAGTITANLTGNVTGALTGNASTATALAADPAACSAGQKVTDIAANGTLTCSATSLTADVSGVLPIANGGTNNSSAYTTGAVVHSDGSKLTEDASYHFWDATNHELRVGTNAVAHSISANEALSVLKTTTSIPSGQYNGAGIRSIVDSNSVMNQVNRGAFIEAGRKITSSVTDTTTWVGLQSRLRADVAAAQTLTSSGSAVASIAAGTINKNSSTGNLAFDYQAFHQLADSITVTGHKTGYHIGGMTGGTSNASIADNVTYSGDWFINSTSSNPSLLTGKLTLAGGLVGSDGTTDATAGNVGEYIESVISSASIGTSGTWTDMGSISLTAGDWDVSGILNVDSNGATLGTPRATMAISVNSGATTTDHVLGSNALTVAIASTPNLTGAVLAPYRLKVSATTTVYLKLLATYTVATPTRVGRISARRMR